MSLQILLQLQMKKVHLIMHRALQLKIQSPAMRGFIINSVTILKKSFNYT